MGIRACVAGPSVRWACVRWACVAWARVRWARITEPGIRRGRLTGVGSSGVEPRRTTVARARVARHGGVVVRLALQICGARGESDEKDREPKPIQHAVRCARTVPRGAARGRGVQCAIHIVGRG